MKKVINLLEELLQDENCGVTILKNEQYRQNDIHSFITNLREKYMGDIIRYNLYLKGNLYKYYHILISAINVTKSIIL